MKQVNHIKVTGEWSAAMTDCATWLNGVGRVALFNGQYDNSHKGTCDGVNDVSTWSWEKLENTRRHVEAQLDAYDLGNGWIFWKFKAENALEWDMVGLVENSLFPMPFKYRSFQTSAISHYRHSTMVRSSFT
jgi:glucan 1,3-beta-glucosidase